MLDLEPFYLSIRLALSTALLLMPACILLSRVLISDRVPGKPVILAIISLPLVLPPTVLGFYLLTLFSDDALTGHLYKSIFNSSLLFSFNGLLFASLIFNLPFAFQPVMNAIKSVPSEIREAAWCCGLSSVKTFFSIELPLIWPGILSGFILTFTHTLGEFGVVLMVGGNIPGETRTVSIDIYDKVQMFNDSAAASLSLILLSISFTAILCIYFLNNALNRYDKYR